MFDWRPAVDLLGQLDRGESSRQADGSADVQVGLQWRGKLARLTGRLEGHLLAPEVTKPCWAPSGRTASSLFFRGPCRAPKKGPVARMGSDVSKVPQPQVDHLYRVPPPPSRSMCWLTPGSPMISSSKHPPPGFHLSTRISSTLGKALVLGPPLDMCCGCYSLPECQGFAQKLLPPRDQRSQAADGMGCVCTGNRLLPCWCLKSKEE